MLGANQSRFARDITAIRQDGRLITQSHVWKWLNRHHRLSVEDAVCIHELTDGAVSAADFHPSLTRLLALVERKRQRRQRKAA